MKRIILVLVLLVTWSLASVPSLTTPVQAGEVEVSEPSRDEAIGTGHLDPAALEALHVAAVRPLTVHDHEHLDPALGGGHQLIRELEPGRVAGRDHGHEQDRVPGRADQVQLARKGGGHRNHSLVYAFAHGLEIKLLIR